MLGAQKSTCESTKLKNVEPCIFKNILKIKLHYVLH